MKPEAELTDQELNERIVAQIFARAREIPAGRVISYGELGKLSDPPISGYICGRIMGNVADDVPWWRIVGKDGKLPIRKRNPALEVEQRQRLEEEGVAFNADGNVESRFFV